MRNIIPNAVATSRSMMVAVVLGTGLTASSTQAAPSVRHSARSNEAGPETLRDITRYCQACWRNARLPIDRWDDCTQQVFTRLLERVDPNQWASLLTNEENDERREFVRAIDTVKKRAQRERRYTDLTPDVADFRDSSTDTSVRDQLEAVEQASVEVLSQRQQKIVELTVDGWAVPEIAIELRTTPERVSDEKYKAIRKLRTHLGVDALA